MSGPRTRLRGVLACLPAATLGVTGALALSSCGSSGKGLIPAASAGPLQGDVDAVEAAAKSGNGSCAETETALLKLDQDYANLPSTLNGGLRGNLRQGVANLRTRALALCAQPLPGSTNTTVTKTSTTPTTPTTTTKTETSTTQTTTAPPPSEEEAPGEVGGTPAPGEGEEGEGRDRGRGNGPGGEGPPGQEAGK